MIELVKQLELSTFYVNTELKTDKDDKKKKYLFLLNEIQKKLNNGFTKEEKERLCKKQRSLMKKYLEIVIKHK